MRPSETARAAPALAARDPEIDLLPGKIEDTDTAFDSGRQAGRIVLGVDIGVSGALAVLTEAGELVSVGDMPVLADGPAERLSVNAPLLAELVAKSHAMCAFVESDRRIHPVAELFPLMEGAEFDALVADIRANGLINPITLFEGMVLDGRNRLRACEKAGVAARYETYAGGDPAGFVVSQNVARRHLNESQRALVAARLANLPHGGDRRSDQAANLPLEISQTDAARMLNVGERSVRSAKAVMDKADPAVFKAVEQGRLAVSHAVEIIELPVEDQQSLAALPDRNIVGSHERIKKARKRDETLRRIQAQAGATPEWPTGRFAVLYADPPWKDDFGPNGCETERHFPTMELNEIKALPVHEIATSDALLYLWALPHMAPKAWEVMTAWSFAHRTEMVWVKDRAGLGQWTRNQHEILMIGRRGAFPPPPEALRSPSVIYGPVGKHSEKPAIFAELIERFYPGLSKIELFCRGQARPGWSAWGNEAETPQR